MPLKGEVMSSSNQLLPQNPAEPLVCVEAITKTISNKAGEISILEAITFSVPANSLFAINGPSGSGKSTLLNILTGIDRPSTGRILFAGQEIRKMSENQLSKWRGKHVGIVFQFFQLLPTLTAQENILLALELGGIDAAPRMAAALAGVFADGRPGAICPPPAQRTVRRPAAARRHRPRPGQRSARADCR